MRFGLPGEPNPNPIVSKAVPVPGQCRLTEQERPGPWRQTFRRLGIISIIFSAYVVIVFTVQDGLSSHVALSGDDHLISASSRPLGTAVRLPRFRYTPLDTFRPTTQHCKICTEEPRATNMLSEASTVF